LFQDNPSEKNINQGTLVAFNLDPSISNDSLHQIFVWAYGEVKEVTYMLTYLFILTVFSLAPLNVYVVLGVFVTFLLKLQNKETPHKKPHKFIEFYDVKAAEVALKDLNLMDIVGQRS